MATNIGLNGPGREVVQRATERVGKYVHVFRTQEAVDAGAYPEIFGLLQRVDERGIKLTRGYTSGETYIAWADIDDVEGG